MTLNETLRSELDIDGLEQRLTSVETDLSDRPTKSEIQALVEEVVSQQTADGYPDDDAPSWFDTVGGFYKRPPGRVTREEATVVARTAETLLDAVSTADATVWVPNNTTIDLTGIHGHSIADGVTIASGRDVANDVAGGTLSVDDYANDNGEHVFKTYAKNVRITGLQLSGPSTEREQYDEATARCFGLFVGDSCSFDNNDVFGWPFAGFTHGAHGYAPSHVIRHNHFHDNFMEGLGYGVELINGHHDIHHNYFERTRHAISGFGFESNGYEAWHNVVGPTTMSHAFDMHDLGANISGGGDVAGGTITIRSNLFQFTHDVDGDGQEAIAIRGVPAKRCDIDDNDFQHDTKPSNTGDQGSAYRQETDSWQNIWASGNTFGTSLTFDTP